MVNLEHILKSINRDLFAYKKKKSQRKTRAIKPDKNEGMG